MPYLTSLSILLFPDARLVIPMSPFLASNDDLSVVEGLPGQVSIAPP